MQEAHGAPMKDKDNPSRKPGGCGAGVLRFLALMFFLGFVFSTVQWLIFETSELAVEEELPRLSHQDWLTGASAAASLLLAIILFRNSRRSG